MEIKKYESRDEIPVKDTWAIEDLYENDEVWSAELETLAEDTKLLASFEGKLGQDAQTLCNYLREMERVGCKAELLGSYCSRKSDQDTRNSAARAMVGRFRTLYTALGAAASFETPEIMAIDDETLESFYVSAPVWSVTAGI